MARFRLDNWKRWKGNCYEAATAFLMARPDAMLVHGTPMGRGPLKGKRFGHAWCEIGDTVYDLTIPGGNQGVDKLVYYAMGDIIPAMHVWRYTHHDACIRMLQHGHYGPWEGPAAECGLHSQRKRKRRKKAGKATPV